MSQPSSPTGAESVAVASPIAAWRDFGAIAALAVSFLAACFFYGVGFNLLFLWVSVALSLLAAGLLGSALLLSRAAANPFSALLAGYGLVALLLVQLVFSISPDSSNAPSWILACLPIWFFVALACQRQQWLWRCMIGLVLVMALVAFTRFVLFAQRAFDPLADPGNFGTLIYLVWIPLTHWLLVRRWYGPRTAWQVPALVLGTFIFLTPLFATASRAAQALVVAVLVGWLILALVRRVSLRPVLLVGVGMLASFALFSLRSPDMLAAMGVAGGLDPEQAPNLRLLMIGGAWEAIQSQGWWGSGVYTFSLLYPLYRPFADQTSPGLLVHNDFVQLLLEGGLWLFIPLLVLTLSVAWQCIRSLLPRTTVSELSTAGGYWALAAMLVHSLVNFVLYIPALAGLAGLVAAWAQSHRSLVPLEPGDQRGFYGWLTALLLGLVALAYLALDVVNLNVFSGQPGFGLSDRYRQSSAAQLEFARLSERLNGDRGLPVLGQAMLLRRQAQRQPESDYLREQTVATFRRALQKDVWNPQAYIGFAEFLSSLPAEQAIRFEETPESLLVQALSVDPKHTETILALVRTHDANQESALAYQVLQRQAYPWLELIGYSNPEKRDLLLNELGRRALAAKDQKFFAQLVKTRERLLATPPLISRTVWFMDWRAARHAAAVQ